VEKTTMTDEEEEEVVVVVDTEARIESGIGMEIGIRSMKRMTGGEEVRPFFL
jgi:hypothetical protein